MLNFIWAGFFIVGFICAAYQSLIGGDLSVWQNLSTSLFGTAKTAFLISINLTGLLCLWLGMLKIAEKSGLTGLLAKALAPLFGKIMPDVPQNHPALGSIIMNMAANMLGLDNAATPMGLKAMEQLQELNPKKDTASPAQVLFMVLNASAVTLIPITILMYRAELGSANPSAVFIPILFATSASTLAGFLAVAYVQNVTGSSSRVGTNQSRATLTVILKPWEERKKGGMMVQDVMEAASIDGCTGFQTTRHVVMPLMAGSFVICLFLSLQRCFMVYDVNLSLTDGGPYGATRMAAMHVYQKAFISREYGMGQAEALLLFAVVLIIVLAQIYLGKRREVDA